MEIYKDSLHSLIDSESYNTIKELPCAITYNTGSLLESVLNSTLRHNGLVLGGVIAPHVKGMVYGMSDVPNIIVTYYTHGLDVLKVALTDVICKCKNVDFDTMHLLVRKAPIIDALIADSNEDDANEILADVEEICIGFAQHGFLSLCNTFQIMDLLESDEIQPYVNNIAFKIQNFFELKFCELYEIDDFLENIITTNHYKYFAKEILIAHKDVKTPFVIGKLEDNLLGIFDVKYVTKNLEQVDINQNIYKCYKDIIVDLERAVNVDGLSIPDIETLYMHAITTACKDLNGNKEEQDILTSLIKSCILKNIVANRKYLGSQLLEKSLVW